MPQGVGKKFIKTTLWHIDDLATHASSTCKISPAAKYLKEYLDQESGSLQNRPYTNRKDYF
jgi:hypothetical protein